MDLDEARQKMHKIVEFTRGDVATIRTGRANPAIVENVMINAYGGTTKMRVMELATITSPEPAQLLLTPYDQSIIGDIRRDLEAANLGVVPVIDNNAIRMTFPALTTERRMEYVKMLHVKLEDGRVKVRQVRHEMMGDLKRAFEAREITEDDRHRTEKELQDLTDKMMAEIEAAGKAKEEDVMRI